MASPGPACGAPAPLGLQHMERKQLSCCLHDCMQGLVCCSQHSGAHHSILGHLNLYWREADSEAHATISHSLGHSGGPPSWHLVQHLFIQIFLHGVLLRVCFVTPAEAFLSVALWITSSGCSAVHCTLSTDDRRKFDTKVTFVLGLCTFAGGLKTSDGVGGH
ncbi:hypothetical protein WJX77_006134 [Trebouxia sp. C0004]